MARSQITVRLVTVEDVVAEDEAHGCAGDELVSDQNACAKPSGLAARRSDT